jgi:hypothetical protein
VSSAQDVPQQGGKKIRSNIYAHVRLDDRLIYLSEHEVRDQDIKERLHFYQREALAYAGLQGAMRLSKVLVEYDRNIVREVQRRTSACWRKHLAGI